MKKTKIKLVRSGNILEFYSYEDVIIHGLPMNKNGRGGNGEELPDEVKDMNKARGVQRAKEKFIRLINSNPDLTRFLTLTFKGDVRDVEEANKLYNAFIKRVQTKHPSFKGIGVTEFQDENRDGVVHYHLLVNIYLPFKEWTELWKYKTYRRKRTRIKEAGHVFIQWAQDKTAVDNVGLYMVNGYMKKTFADERLEGFKKYKRHGKLKAPQEISFADEEEMKSYLLDNNINLNADKMLKSYEYEMKGRENNVNFTVFNLSEHFSREKMIEKMQEREREGNRNGI